MGNGSEFLNDLMLDFWEVTFEDAKLSRSHFYEKNDNRYVEQRNLTLVRNYLGYQRFDTVVHTLALNQLYDKLWLYDNFFQPVMHLTEKTVISSSNGSRPKIKRRYDQAQTPFDHVCAADILSQEQQEHLVALRNRTNPRQLRKEIYTLIDHISTLPNAVPDQTEDVYQTLLEAEKQN